MDWQALITPLTAADAPDMFALEQAILAKLPSPRWYYPSSEADFAFHAGAGHACGIRLDGRLIALNILVPSSNHPDSYAAVLGLQEPNTLDFEDVMVAPEYRRQGIHSAFLTRSIILATEAGCSSIFATVDPDNLPSLRAFERFGFQQIILRPTYDGRPRIFLRFVLAEPAE